MSSLREMLSKPYIPSPLKPSWGSRPNTNDPWSAQVLESLDWKTPPRLFRHSVVPSQPPFPTTQVSWLAVLTKRSTHCGGVPTRTETGLQLPSYPNQSVLTGIETAEGFGAVAVKATVSKHTIVSSKGSKLLLPHLVIAAILESQNSDCDAPQLESRAGVEEVERRNETMSLSTISGV